MTPRQTLWALISGANTGAAILVMYICPPVIVAFMFGITAIWTFKEAMYAGV